MKVLRTISLTSCVAVMLCACSANAMEVCGEGRRVTCVVDGDTFWLERVKYRIADIDAPEVSDPKCDAELALGQRATVRLAELLDVGRFEIQPTGTDQYGRSLAIVVQDGRSIGQTLIDEGLARAWNGKREPWC